MKHIFITISQYLAATLLVALCLSAFGCADSASVNPVVELASLTVTPGTLQPAFNSTITQYNIDLTSDIATVTVTAQPAVAGDTVTINGLATTSRAITLGAPGSTTSVNIVVSESGSNSRTYTVLIVRAGPGGNNSLENLTVSPGTLAPTFNANTLPYTVSVANNVDSVDITPKLQDPLASVTVNGDAVISDQPHPVSLKDPGQSTLISIIVTAQNGNQKPYLVTVNRGISGNNNLDDLTISPGRLTPTFSAETTGYSVDVASNVDSVVVTPTVADTTATLRMRVNVEPFTDITSGVGQPITLPGPNSSTFITIEVTAQNGSQKNYVILVNKATLGDNNLSALTVEPGTSGPNLITNFSPNTLTYTVNVGTGDGSVTVSAIKAVPTAEMLIESILISPITVPGGTPSSGPVNIPLTGPGTNTIVSISVTAPNGGTPKTYTVTVHRPLSGNNSLSNLEVTLVGSGPNLINNFDPSTLSYTVDVASDIFSVTVIATLQDTNATMEVNSQGTSSGQAREITPLQPPGSPTVITIRVTPPNGIFKDYTVTVNRAPLAGNNNLSALTVALSASGPNLINNFDPSTLSYTVDVASDIFSVTVIATLQDTNATMEVNSQGTSSGQAREITPLQPPGSPTVITVRVTPPNGIFKDYTVTVNRAP